MADYCDFLGACTAVLLADPVPRRLRVGLRNRFGIGLSVEPGRSLDPVHRVQRRHQPNAHTNGTVLAPDYQYGSLQAEATGRQAVQLVGQGKYVSFKLTKAANAVDFHYAIPDSLEGGGITAPLDLYVNGKLTTALSLTSEFSWLYGTYPYTNTPFVSQPDGEVPHDYYNDVRYQFPDPPGRHRRQAPDRPATTPRGTSSTRPTSRPWAPRRRAEDRLHQRHPGPL
jgi:hypothetical protein